MDDQLTWLTEILEAWERASREVRDAQDMIANARRRGIWFGDLPAMDLAVRAGNRTTDAVGEAVGQWGEAYRDFTRRHREAGGDA